MLFQVLMKLNRMVVKKLTLEISTKNTESFQLLQLVLGLGTIPVSMNHLDGHEMVKFMTWAQGIFTFQGDASSYVADAHIIFKTHLVLGLTILLLFPFTRLVHMLSAPVRYVWRPGYQVVRSRKLGLRHG